MALYHAILDDISTCCVVLLWSSILWSIMHCMGTLQGCLADWLASAIRLRCCNEMSWWAWLCCAGAMKSTVLMARAILPASQPASLNGTTAHHTTPHQNTADHNIAQSTAQHSTEHSTPHHCNILWPLSYTTLYYSKLHYIILYYTILYSTKLACTKLSFTILQYVALR